MNSTTKDLLTELTEAMQKMPNDPQGVAGWLLSNYRFQKVGAAEPVEKFHRKGSGPGGIDESNLKVDPSYNEFMKRNNAGALVARGEQLAKLKHGGNEKLAELASVIQSGYDPYGDTSTSTLNTEPAKPVESEDKKAYQEMRSAGFDPFAAQTPMGGLVDMSQIDSRKVAQMTNILESVTQGSNAPLEEEVLLSQSAEGRAYLQRDRFKKLKAQDAVAGGGTGLFRR
jgi:hypothetical protein